MIGRFFLPVASIAAAAGAPASAAVVLDVSGSFSGTDYAIHLIDVALDAPSRVYRAVFTASQPMYLQLAQRNYIWFNSYGPDGEYLGGYGDFYDVNWYQGGGASQVVTQRLGYYNVSIDYIWEDGSYDEIGQATQPFSATIDFNEALAPGAVATYRLLITTVPEPAAWALMIGGFLLTGQSLRRRAKVAAFAR